MFFIAFNFMNEYLCTYVPTYVVAGRYCIALIFSSFISFWITGTICSLFLYYITFQAIVGDRGIGGGGLGWN